MGSLSKAAAAADVQQGEALERPQALPAETAGRFPADEFQPDGVEFVQGGEFPARVPPFRRDGREFGHFRRIDRTALKVFGEADFGVISEG